MKKSLIATTIIVALFACLGWQGRNRLDQARVELDRVLASAGSQGLEPDADGKGMLSSSKSAAARADSLTSRQARAKEAARKLTIFGSDPKALWDITQASDQDAALEYEEGMAEATGMDVAGLKLLVDEIVDNGGLNDKALRTLIFMLASNVSHEEPAHSMDMVVYAMSRMNLDELYTHEFSKVIGMTLRMMSTENPQGALDWIERNGKDHPEAISEETRSMMMMGIAMSDTKLAFASLGELGITKNPQTFQDIGHTATTAEEAISTLAVLRDYAARAGSDEERQIAVKNTLAGLAVSLTEGGYEEGSKRLELAALSRDETAGLASGLEAGATEGDTGKWIDWMSGKIPADQLEANVTKVMKSWTENDYQAAGTWLESVSEGPVKDAAVKSYADTVAATDPEVASQWAMTLPAGGGRVALLKDIYTEWRKKDEAAAQRFAEANGIGE